MANNISFQPMGNCVAVTATTANTQGNVVSITATSPVNQYFIFNTDKNDPVFVTLGQTSDITATIPTEIGSSVIPIAPSTEKVFTSVQCSPTKTVYARIIAPHANAKVYITPGEGL